MNISCANGFAFGGAAGGPTIQSFSCVPSGPAASTWSPNPSVVSCQGLQFEPFLRQVLASCFSLHPSFSLTWTAAVSCPNTTRPNSTVPMLVGVTQASVSVTCSSGFAIDGGTSTTTSFSYTCAGLSPGASNWTSLSRRCLPVNCPATLLVNTNTSMTLAGVTGNVLSPVCANGFSVDGGTSTTTTQSYTCSGTVPGASAWQPNPTSKFCQGVCMCVRCTLHVCTLHVGCAHATCCMFAPIAVFSCLCLVFPKQLFCNPWSTLCSYISRQR
jgi:hypothetical protein